MNFRIIESVAALTLLVSGCGASATPTPVTLEDVQSTSMAAAFTVIAETHAALPSETSLPPTETPTETIHPSDTPEPSLTLEVSPTPVFTASPTSLPSFTPQATAQESDPCNKVLTAWQGPSISMAIRYEYKPQGKKDKVVLSLWVMSDRKECGFLASHSTGPVGQYSALAYVDGDKDFKVFGGFRLTEGSWEIIIRNDNIVAKGGCYPNC